MNGGHFIFTIVGTLVIGVALAMQGDYSPEQRRHRIGYYVLTGLAWIFGLSWAMRLIHG